LSDYCPTIAKMRNKHYKRHSYRHDEEVRKELKRRRKHFKSWNLLFRSLLCMTNQCDACEKSVKITPTVRYKIRTDALLILCKDCWTKRGWIRDRYSGQIQLGYYLAN